MKLVEFDHLLLKNKMEENDKLEDFLNRDSRQESLYFADAAVKNRLVGEFIQF